MATPSPGKPRVWSFALFLLFVVAYNVFRIALFGMTQTGAVTTDRPLDAVTNAIVVYSELAIGLAGLAAVPGLVGSKPWGFWATVAVNAYAIVFDAASAVGVQLSAAGGILPAVAILLLLLLAFRPRFFPARDGAAGATVPPA